MFKSASANFMVIVFLCVILIKESMACSLLRADYEKLDLPTKESGLRELYIENTHAKILCEIAIKIKNEISESAKPDSFIITEVYEGDAEAYRKYYVEPRLKDLADINKQVEQCWPAKYYKD